ncbi:MAG TPA: NAD(P)H-dependent oxidoreductase subunit E [Blastocatellia bacterium]
MQPREQLEQRLDALAPKFPRPQTALPEAVNLIRDSGYEPDEELILRLAELCSVPPKDVESFLAFYSAQPPAARPNVASVCTGIICHLNGAGQLLSEMCNTHCIGGHQLDEVRETGCLGMCYAAPVVRVGHQGYWSAVNESDGGQPSQAGTNRPVAIA